MCTSAGLAERAKCGRTWEVHPVLPPLASWDASTRAKDPWCGEFWIDPTPEPPASAFEDAPRGVVGADNLERLLRLSPPMVC
jgi:hypothetical protein